ncbi:transposon Ty3-I Gag-Pol polyprotein [Trichonephila clavipes]|nr:transposon Ty3-I Gag-Pol polyprotein [Trichonephila clavipes]
MRPNETVFQYLVAIRELANRGQGFLDETSIMEHCINGIPDSPSNKLILYGCTTIQEFKEKLGIYDKIFQNKSKNHSYDTSRNPNFSSQRRDVEKPSPSSPQKDGSPRVCIDFRKLNRVLVKDHYPLPLIEDILDKLQDTRVFSTIDLRLTGYFRKFIPAYSVIAKPLSDLLRKDTPFNFDVKQKASFDEIKRLLSQKPVLGLPRANGQVERINRTIIPVLSKMSEDDPTKWFKHVPSLQEVLNSTFQRSINTTPFELLFETQINNKIDLRIQQLIDEQLQLEFNENRELLRKAAKTQILKVQNENKKSYNLRRKSYLYSVKDLVAIKNATRTWTKICNKFIGPYKITQVKPNDTKTSKNVEILMAQPKQVLVPNT